MEEERVYALYITAQNRAQAAVRAYELLKGGIVDIAEKLDETGLVKREEPEYDVNEWEPAF